jgi:GNAT superfamily N-acetyltransferase
MAALSLIQFARTHRTPPAPGTEVIVTPRYQIQLIPDFPIPGPNSISWIRCDASEADDVIREAQATVAERGLPVSWILDPDARPPDFADRLREHGIHPDPSDEKSLVMILPAEARLEAPDVPGLEIKEALSDLELYRVAEAVAAEAFAGLPFGEETGISHLSERRFANNRAAGNRHHLLATIEGEPAGSGSLSLFPPDGAIMNGGGVRPRFRGAGVYKALVAARLDLARRAGAAGVVVWGGHMSAPILSRLGFETVSWRKFYI